ncbi:MULTISPECIES: 3-hydroxyacyl-CoA dehydrogenase NAD-binding domain-containing protein [unclassified Cryobacterium]|uniref:3-hydroxyacyl-CoA dehydrogenase NAD-binding domain-containing protein n=1 Tax=unclassified Cryobacterium TaxID=2649013 RepID=UPI002AB40715|nr:MULTISPECIES: 3-hydroxyacyl-CoA dehydrogenase NAD-binding domain-containing protein [unclassified Cryobacterium]MDY7544098.1 3-hydroxyacyl-CoA dehydrogenase NAD-binding domain-containing protein [Cryobacterium sp. 5B3]MEA9997954.1 3-hydroxyacyl-CoA dehydrogenase NAD-binding domain-containing protein [Cryobacterium sp. RTS3]MEB0265192.1 3-hydroxyacyl-CoA dehydrogenase NAD-binding domain-containing protein [Cryobacterium sp. 10I5]MEB0273285.1 3-hydroxyacyl-CoA dehydrogenase NAD-binding domain-
MTDYSALDFSELVALSGDEVVTHSFVRDVPLSGARTLALVTLDNGRDHTRPNTLGPVTLLEFAATLDGLAERASRGEIHGVAVTGKPFILAAGADLGKVSEIPSLATGKLLGQLGHHALGKLSTLGVPSFVFINGLALGGGLEIALNADYRTVDASVAAVALPEVSLGLIPGWGGSYLLPNLIGIENALTVIISNPLKNRVLKAPDTVELGIADVLFGSAAFLEHSIAWADGVIAGKTTVARPNKPGKIERLVKWDAAIGIARRMLETRIGSVALSPYIALDLLKAAKSGTREEGFEREDDSLAALIAGDQLQASIYAFNLVQKRAKRPAGSPDKKLARPITKVGVIGAGLMASQFALLFVRRLQVPVVITDLDQARVDKGVAYIHGEIATLQSKGRITADEGNRLRALVTGTTDKSQFSDADWVIEAVFEELGVKQDVFAEIEKYVSPEAILATNTSSLSVEKIGAKLAHPERLVGFHFFNPVAVMPLIEVVNTPQTNETTLSTAMVIAGKLRKNAVITRDTPGFVVNRILAKLLGEAMHAVDTGTPFEVVDGAIAPFGLPMTPFELLELVGLKVGAHVLDTHHAAFPDRFFESDNLHRLAEHGKILERDGKGKVTGFDKTAKKIVAGGTTPMTGEEILRRIEDGLADEIKRMLDDDVVHAAEDIDLCVILGAGWPFQMGGATPYLDRVGASERVFGGTFHTPMIRGVASEVPVTL